MDIRRASTNDRSLRLPSLLMTREQRQRGPHPQDEEIFTREAIPTLNQAVDELSWLLTRGYARSSALALVGDRYKLKLRQRNAVGRSACGEAELNSRRRTAIPLDQLQSARLAIDGFNLLILLESALSRAPVFRGRDGCLRNVASVQGTYRMVAETPRAIESVGALLDEVGVATVEWHLDQPVSNSGRLKTRILEAASRHDWPWKVYLNPSPDATLANLSEGFVVVSSDSWILDRCAQWTDVAGPVLDRASAQPDASDVEPLWIVELAGNAES